MVSTHIPVLNLDGPDCTAVVDLSDSERVRQHHWMIVRGYPSTKLHNRWLTMHKLIMGDAPARGLSVDHMDRDRLNNRRSNLRWATLKEQCRNRGSSRRKHHELAGIIGVSKSRSGKYTARFRGKHGGTFVSVLEAATKYNEMARAHDREHGIAVGMYNDLSRVA